MKYSMARQSNNGLRLTAFALTLTLAFVWSATCLAATLQAQKSVSDACCAAMSDSCGSATNIEQDCCTVQQPGHTGLIPVASVATLPPTAGATLLLPAPEVRSVRYAFDPGLANPISPPAYLFDSVFRI